jgi:PadR family transcriptional regulator PadR
MEHFVGHHGRGSSEGLGWFAEGRAGREHGRGRHGRRRRVMRFLQPCLLLLLQKGEAHGYSLLSELEGFGFEGDELDPSLVYRALRGMERMGWVDSHWVDESQGPRRRVYAITEEGQAQLELMIGDLQRVRSEIDRVLEAYAARTQKA